MFIRIMSVGLFIWCFIVCASTTYLYFTDPVFTNISDGVGGPIVIVASIGGMFVSFMAFIENERFK